MFGSFLLEIHILQIKSSMFWIRSWWGFADKTILLYQGPPHFSIHTFLSKAHTCSIIILYLCGMYCGFFQHTGFAFPVPMDNSYPRILCFVPSLQKQSQYSLIIAINCSLISGITLLFNLICLCSSSLCSSSLNVIKFPWLPYYHFFMGLSIASPYWWNHTLLYLCHLCNLGGCICFAFLVSILSGVLGSPSENPVLLNSPTFYIK